MSAMSNLAVLADESKYFNEFAAKVFREYKDVIDPAEKMGFYKFLEKVYADLKQNNEGTILEYTDLNDPVLVAMRAARQDFAAKKAEYEKRMKKRIYGAKREKLEDQLYDINQDIHALNSEKSDLYHDMEADAGQMGYEEFEKSGKHDEYGGQLNDIDSQLEKLMSQRRKIEIILAY